MPDLDWTAFRGLPGARWRNWELLCHGLIARAYGRYGTLVSVRVQPVVEFHLTLSKDCPLGPAGEQWGWQCKFWDDERPRLTNSREDVIDEAVAKMGTHLPDLDHWVVWTHRPLSDADWKKIQAKQPAGVTFHTWHEDHVNDLLAGDAAALRAVYFGESVLVPGQLGAAYEETQETLRGLLPELHVSVREERALMGLRGRRQDWPRIAERAAALPARTAALAELGASSVGGYVIIAGPLAAEAHSLAETGAQVTDYLDRGLVHLAVELAATASSPTPDDQQVNDLLHDLDAAGEHDHRDAVTGLNAEVGATARAINHLAGDLTQPLVAVVAEVGRGKTHLAAKLAAADGVDPAGALVAARSFRTTDIDLDRLAGLAGLPAMRIDDLLEALDAAAARAGQRLPLVIDGLNESMSPEAWSDALGRLRIKAGRLQHVYVVVTLRPSYADECLPEDTPGIALRGFPLEWRRACRRYFAHFKIHADIELLPAERFADPLFLRIFCQATNYDREAWVDLGPVPPSLFPAFELFVDQAIDRIRRRLHVDAAEVKQRLRTLALAYWERNARSLPRADVKQIVGDDPLALDDSLAFALEDEGVLDRDMLDGSELLSPVHDALGGYMIADALVPSLQAGTDLVDGQLAGRLHGPDAHPLAEDIRKALGHLLAHRAGIELRLVAQDAALTLEVVEDLFTADPAQITPDARQALTDHVIGGAALGERWTTVFRNRAVAEHPLNARWLDEILRPMTVARRDLDWTEWVRDNDTEIGEQVAALTERWRTGELQPTDRLQLTWLTWMLTSTDRALRDRATEAIYWFGRHDPHALHERTLAMLDLNDPYVPERLMAACYGVAMANQIAGPGWATSIGGFVTELDDRMLKPDAQAPAAHWLLREYALGIRELVASLHPDLASDGEVLTQADIPAPAPTHPRISPSDRRYDQMRRTLGMDFHNYTLGRLVEGRGNYDFEHRGHRALVSGVLGRIWEIGWRTSDFGDIDDRIGEYAARRHDLDPDRVDRYGKKYGWIAYFEAAGRLASAGTLPRDVTRLSDVDIDPSFPENPPAAPVSPPSWVRTRHRTDASWVEKGRVTIPDELLLCDDLAGDPGPWVCLDGLLTLDDDEIDRRVFAFIWGAFVPRRSWQPFAASLIGRGVGRHTMPEPTEDYYTFAGEIPWSARFAAGLRMDGFPDAPTIEHDLPDYTTVELEGTAHEYAWERYHSVVNGAAGVVPSRAICQQLGLRGRPQTFDLADADGRPASRSFHAPDGFGGRLTYLRADLLDRYAAETGREFGWVIWGERELQVDWQDPPQWYRDLRLANADQHRRVCALSDLR